MVVDRRMAALGLECGVPIAGKSSFCALPPHLTQSMHFSDFDVCAVRVCVCLLALIVDG